MLALLLVGWPQKSHLMSLFKINDIGIFYFSDNGDNCLKKKRERERKKNNLETSLAVQWLRRCIFSARDTVRLLGEQLRSSMVKKPINLVFHCNTVSFNLSFSHSYIFYLFKPWLPHL